MPLTCVRGIFKRCGRHQFLLFFLKGEKVKTFVNN